MDRKTSKNIICFGSLIMDISIRCDKIPAMGETVYTYEDYNVNPGGKGGNQSVAAARSGGSVTLIGRIADDDYAHQLIHSFQKDHIDTSQLMVDKDAKTGVAFVWVDMEGHNKCVCSLGVNAKVTVQDVQSYAHLFTDRSIVMTTLEHSSQLLDEISLMARQNNCILIVDPSSKDYSKLTPEIAGRIDILKPNEVETEMLTGIRVETEEDAVQAIHVLKDKGIRMPVISLGSRGVIYEYKGKATSVKGLRVNAVDTTAAGDTFIGSMAAKLSQGYSFQESIDYANRAAAYCVQHRGATPEIAGRIDILKPNEVETEMLTGIRVETEEDAVQAIHVLKDKGIRMPVISLGSRGVIYEYKGKATSVKGLRVNAVDTTAAGDTFIGSMAAKLSQGYSFQESIDYANRAAAYCVQHRGAQISIPFEENVL